MLYLPVIFLREYSCGAFIIHFNCRCIIIYFT